MTSNELIQHHVVVAAHPTQTPAQQPIPADYIIFNARVTQVR